MSRDPRPQRTLTVAEAGALGARVLDEVEKAVVGKREPLTLVLAARARQGTRAARGLPGAGQDPGRPVASPRRWAWTSPAPSSPPTCCPADLTGSFLYDQREREFEFRPGPLFTGLLLADEINRTPAEDPVRAARGDAGAPGHRRGRRPSRCPRPSTCSPPRTRSSTRAPTRCPRPSSTGSCCGSASATPTPTRSTTCSAAGWPGSRRRSRCDRVTDAAGAARRCRPRSRRSPSTRASAGTASTLAARHPRAPATCSIGRLAPRVARPGAVPPARSRVLRGRDYVIPEDVKAVARAGARPPDHRPARAVDDRRRRGSPRRGRRARRGAHRPPRSSAGRRPVSALAPDRGPGPRPGRRRGRPGAGGRSSATRCLVVLVAPLALLGGAGPVHRPTRRARPWRPAGAPPCCTRARAPPARLERHRGRPTPSRSPGCSPGRRTSRCGPPTGMVATLLPADRPGRRRSRSARAAGGAARLGRGTGRADHPVGGLPLGPGPAARAADDRCLPATAPVRLAGRGPAAARTGRRAPVAPRRRRHRVRRDPAVPRRGPAAPDQLAGLAAHRRPARRRAPWPRRTPACCSCVDALADLGRSGGRRRRRRARLDVTVRAAAALAEHHIRGRRPGRAARRRRRRRVRRLRPGQPAPAPAASARWRGSAAGDAPGPDRRGGCRSRATAGTVVMRALADAARGDRRRGGAAQPPRAAGARGRHAAPDVRPGARPRARRPGGAGLAWRMRRTERDLLLERLAAHRLPGRAVARARAPSTRCCTGSRGGPSCPGCGPDDPAVGPRPTWAPAPGDRAAAARWSRCSPAAPPAGGRRRGSSARGRSCCRPGSRSLPESSVGSAAFAGGAALVGDWACATGCTRPRWSPPRPLVAAHVAAVLAAYGPGRAAARTPALVRLWVRAGAARRCSPRRWRWRVVAGRCGRPRSRPLRLGVRRGRRAWWPVLAGARLLPGSGRGRSEPRPRGVRRAGAGAASSRSRAAG